MSIDIEKNIEFLFRNMEDEIKERSRKRAEIWALKSFRDRSAINMEDSLHIMERAKISLNVMTWHKDGFTERVLNSMLAGAAVLSDKSTRLEEEFVNNKEIILFELAQIGALPKRIKALLSKDKEIKEIAENGRKKAMEKHLWKHRAKELLEIISENG